MIVSTVNFTSTDSMLAHFALSTEIWVFFRKKDRNRKKEPVQ